MYILTDLDYYHSKREVYWVGLLTNALVTFINSEVIPNKQGVSVDGIVLQLHLSWESTQV